MEQSLKNRIYNYLRQWHAIDPTKYVHKGEISDCARSVGYSAENAGRRLRELEEAGLIEVSYNDKNEAMYRLKQDRVSIIWQETFKRQEEVTQTKLI